MKLIALRCPVCAQPLSAGEEDIVVACKQCRTPIQLNEQELRPIDVHLAASRPGSSPKCWLPIWIFHGKVDIHKRETQGRQDMSWKKLWAEPRYFYIPAWALSIEGLNQVSVPLLHQQPRFHAMPANQIEGLVLQPVTVSAEDAKKLLEFLVLEIEVERKDWLKRIEFDVAASKPALWALPAETGNRLVALESQD